MSTRSHPSHGTRARAPRREGGFTLVELMVTIIILTIGILALAGTSAVITNHIGGGAQMALAASTAQARFERLRAHECMKLDSGSAESRGITEEWKVEQLGRAVEVTLVVSFHTTRGDRSHEYKTRIPCPDLIV